MKVKDEIVSKKGKLTRLSLLFVLFNLFFFVSCGVKDNKETSLVSDFLIENLEEDKQNMKYEDYGVYAYWENFLQNESENLEKLQYIIEWSKKNDYCTALTVYSDYISTLPSNKKTEKKIQSEEGFDRVKGFLLETKLSIVNYWSSSKRIDFLYRFDFEDTHGNYCLIYVEDGLKDHIGDNISKESINYYKKLSENFYSYVIFYE